MTDQNIIPEVSALWEKRINCAQATGKGLLDHYKFIEAGDVLMASFIPYGGGFMSGNVCGAVSGTLAATSYILKEKKCEQSEIQQVTDQLKEKFAKEFGSINCADIMAPFFDMRNINIKDFKLDNTDYTKSAPYKLCTSCVNKATIMAKELIEKHLSKL